MDELLIQSHDKSHDLGVPLLLGKIRSSDNRILATHSPKDTTVYIK